MNYDDNYLEHHGILGQKWGDQNGPPYPLKDGMHSALEKAKGAASKASKAVKSYRIKQKRKKAAKKARETKAENKRKAEEQALREKIQKKKEERFDKFVKNADKVDKTRQAIEKYVNAYNYAVKLAAPWLNKHLTGSDGKAILKEIGKEYKSPAQEFIDNLVNNATAQEVYANRNKLSYDQIAKAKTRLDNEKKIKELAEEDKANKK